MYGYYVSMTGLMLDLAGATFLSVEAIKLQNLAKLRDRLLIPFHQRTLPIPIEFVDAEEFESLPHSQRFSFWRGMPLWLFTHFSMGLIIVVPALFAVDRVFGVHMVEMGLGLVGVLPTWAKALLYSLGGLYLLIFIAAGPGELIHKALQRVSLGAVSAMFWIDRRTPDGAIGIIGFGLLVLGFGGQILGTWLSAPPSACV